MEHNQSGFSSQKRLLDWSRKKDKAPINRNLILKKVEKIPGKTGIVLTRLKTFSKPLDFKNKASYLTFIFASFQILLSHYLKIIFWRLIFEFIFQTTHHKSTNATACLRKHVATLMLDFNLRKIFFYLCFYEDKTINRNYFTLFRK